MESAYHDPLIAQLILPNRIIDTQREQWTLVQAGIKQLNILLFRMIHVVTMGKCMDTSVVFSLGDRFSADAILVPLNH